MNSADQQLNAPGQNATPRLRFPNWVWWLFVVVAAAGILRFLMLKNL